MAKPRISDEELEEARAKEWFYGAWVCALIDDLRDARRERDEARTECRHALGKYQGASLVVDELKRSRDEARAREIGAMKELVDPPGIVRCDLCGFGYSDEHHTPEMCTTDPCEGGRPCCPMCDTEGLTLERDEAREESADVRATYRSLADQTATAEAQVVRLRETLLRVLPECFVCPTCGPLVKADEDGLCASCGADTTLQDTAQALEAATEPAS